MAERPAESEKKKKIRTIHSTCHPTIAYHCLTEKKEAAEKKLSIDQINSFSNLFNMGWGKGDETIKFPRRYKVSG